MRASLGTKEKYQMSRLYGPVHRSLQDRFDTRRLADNVEARLVLTEILSEHKAFIESRDMFFLSTIEHQGRPTVCYKGGDPGFVRVIDSKAVVFPCYDGNGMFYSMGNLLGNQQIGMLFINFVCGCRASPVLTITILCCPSTLKRSRSSG
jgi:hypothetical protein